MKIRTKLSLFLLPTLFGSALLITALLSYNWYREILGGVEAKIETALISSSALLQEEPSFEHLKTWEESHLSVRSQKVLKEIQEKLQISRLYWIRPSQTSHFFDPKNQIASDGIRITPVYSTKKGKQMTGYTPLFFDGPSKPSLLLAADIDMDQIDQKLQWGVLVALFSIGAAFLIVIFLLWMISYRIARPIQKLNNSAMAIAAGQYGKQVKIKGPKEIKELANTFNIMSECLNENLNRVKENSLLKEQMYSELECARLLQNYMLQKTIDECTSDATAASCISFISNSPRGLLLNFPFENDQLLKIHLVEAEENGFEGMYHLLTQYKLLKETDFFESRREFPFLHLELDKEKNIVSYQSYCMPDPIFWSTSEQSFLPNEKSLEAGDYFFLFNRGLLELYKEKIHLKNMFQKVLSLFAIDGLKTCEAMLQKEISFACKRKIPTEDIHLICFQRLLLYDYPRENPSL
jgi:HAMP domain-containing protein